MNWDNKTGMTGLLSWLEVSMGPVAMDHWIEVIMRVQTLMSTGKIRCYIVYQMQVG